jgi:hypothetical protein
MLLKIVIVDSWKDTLSCSYPTWILLTEGSLVVTLTRHDDFVADVECRQIDDCTTGMLGLILSKRERISEQNGWNENRDKR